jgi:GT2 family glycosyltransferase
LNYNTKELLLENLETCLGSGITPGTLLVWDNQSSDGSAEAVRQRFPQVRVVSSERNLGYAAGMNRIVETTDAERVVLVTADCFITLHTVHELLRAMDTENDVAIAGCRIIDRRTGRIQSEGGDITYPLGVPLARNWQKAVDPSDVGRVVDVAYVDGAAVAVDRRRFRELGGFDESYFAYAEDLDLCWRARLQGQRVVCVGSAVGVHVTYGSFRHYPFLRWSLSERNRIANNIKNLGPLHLLVALLYEALYFGSISIGTSVLHVPAYRSAYYSGIVWLIRNRRLVMSQREKIQRSRVRSDDDVVGAHPRMGLLKLAKPLSQRASFAAQVET